MKRFIESLVVFASILGIWVVFAIAATTLVASFFPKEEIVEIAGGGVSLLSLFIAIGLAARIMGRRRARYPDGV